MLYEQDSIWKFVLQGSDIKLFEIAFSSQNVLYDAAIIRNFG